MSEQGVPVDEATAGDFIMVRAALVKRLGGANEALVWERVRYRTQVGSAVAYERDERRWWPCTPELAGDEVGLSGPQCRRALESLVDRGFLVREQHSLSGNYDRRYSYSPIVLGGQMHLPKSSDQRDEFGRSDLPNSSNAPSVKNWREGEKEESDVVDVDPEVRRLCDLLLELVTANGHKAKVSDSWVRECDRLMRLDEYSAEQVEWVMRWACEQSTFWPANIRSMPKLREKFSTLKAQALAEHGKRRGQSTVDIGRAADEILRDRAAAREQLAVNA